MPTEPITGLTYQAANSLQTDVLQKAQLNYFAAWLNSTVKSVGDNAPAATPANGDCYIVGTVPTGAWSGHADALAVYRDGWQFYVPKEGAQVLNLADGLRYNFTSGSWGLVTAASAAPSVQTVTSSATVTPVVTNDKVVISAQATGLTITNPSGSASEGQGFVIALKDNGTARRITFGSSYRAMGATLPASTTISKWMYIPVMYNATDSKWDVFPVSQQA